LTSNGSREVPCDLSERFDLLLEKMMLGMMASTGYTILPGKDSYGYSYVNMDSGMYVWGWSSDLIMWFVGSCDQVWSCYWIMWPDHVTWWDHMIQTSIYSRCTPCKPLLTCFAFIVLDIFVWVLHILAENLVAVCYFAITMNVPQILHIRTQ
jgi:hypothetical protein